MRKLLSVYILCCVLLLLPGCVFSGINDSKAEKMYNAILEELKEKDEIEIIDSVYGCGNTSGTGDHTDLLVGVLVTTELSEEELEKLYEYNGKTRCVVHNASTDGLVSNEMNGIKQRFEIEGDVPENCYIIQYITRTAFSWLDLRGA